MEGRSVNSLRIFWLESPAHTSAKIIRMCPKGLILNRAGHLRKRLLHGEQVQLKAVGLSDFPTLGPQVVTVTISHGGLDRMKMSGRSVKGDRFIIHSEIPFIANFFVNVPDTKVWLTNPAPAGFLRWEGPIVLPNDPLIRVDLLSGTKSGPAEPSGG